MCNTRGRRKEEVVAEATEQEGRRTKDNLLLLEKVGKFSFKMSSQTAAAARVVLKNVRPILSMDRGEARRRVLQLYKAWYREIPLIVMNHRLPKSPAQCRAKLREEFEKHRNVTDVRVIDMLIVKGQQELKECVNIWKQPCHIMAYWRDTVDPKPKDFLSKFLDGHE